MTTALSVVFALGAAALFGTSSVLQQAAAQREAGSALLGLGLLRRLARRPRWLAAVGLAVVSFGVQAVALAFGPLALVQPVAATDLLFALPILAHRSRSRLRFPDWLGAGLVAGGVAAFLALSPPSRGRAHPDLDQWLLALTGVVFVVGVAVPLALRARPIARTGLLAVAGAAVFALVDALTKSVVELIAAEGPAGLLHWEPYGLLAAGVSGLALSQAAYRSGSLFVSLPIIDAVEPVGAVVIGATVFAEHIAGSRGTLIAQLVAGAVAVAGIVVLDRSPLVASTHGPGAPDDR